MASRVFLVTTERVDLVAAFDVTDPHHSTGRSPVLVEVAFAVEQVTCVELPTVASRRCAK